ncbi:MAG: hypothetical protein M3O20_09585 [Acidobacteriota bacterium]|nr:hypothetical protein [Acidobacteriota bacterium]
MNQEAAKDKAKSERASVRELATLAANHWSFEVVVFILAFSVVVLKTQEIQDTFSSLIPESLGVTIFWVCVAAWVVSFGARKRAESKVSASNRLKADELSDAVGKVHGLAGQLKTRMEEVGGTATKLDSKLAGATKSIDRVLGAVETLPHATFRAAWMQQSFSISKLATSAPFRRDEIELKELVGAIRAIVASAASLAESYDVGTGARYAANIMFFVPNLGKPPYFEDEYWKVVRFKPHWCEENRNLVDGVLILKKELSAKAGDPRAADAINDLGFITENHPLSGKWRILPGAPRAFAGGLGEQKYAAHGYRDVAKIGELNQQDFMIEKDILMEVEKYYSQGEGANVKSFVAFTIPRVRDQAANPLGVLNIHSDRVGMLGGAQDKFQIFAQLMAPFIGELAWAAELWAEKTGMRIGRA